LPAIEPLDASPLNDLEAFEILDLASRFSWEVQASGTLLAGWCALAPICGALDWRPHAWLTAAAGSGKSELLNKFVAPLLGSISLWPLGDSTEAFIRQELRCDALPVVFDEAESNEQKDKTRVQSILSLARVASSSGRGVVGRGSADGHAQRFTIQSMFLLSSVSTALKQGADKSRFAQLILRNPSEIPIDQRSAHWSNLKADLERIISYASGQRLQARIVNLIPVIRESAIIFKTAAGEYFRNQRQGDQYGTLMAGAWALQSSQVPTAAQAMDCLQGLDWEPYQQATEHSDELACLQTLLEYQLRIESREGALTRTVAELVSIAARRSPSLQIEPGVAEDLLGRNGFRVDGDCLLISNTATAIARILSVTPWASCWAQTLSRVHGATRPGPSRFKGIGLCRCVGIPLSTVTV
jgi:putative DNA primase/helicase